MNFIPFATVRIAQRNWCIEKDLYRLSGQQGGYWETAVALERGVITSNNQFRYVDLVIATPGELGAEVMAEHPLPRSHVVQYTWYEKICEAAIKQGFELCDTRVVLAFVLEHRPSVVPQDRRRGGYAPVMKAVQWEGYSSIFEISVDSEKDRFGLYLSRRFLTSMSNHGHWKMDEQLIFVKPRIDENDQCR